MTMRANVGLCNLINDSGFKTAFDGNGGLKINIYTGSQPATADLAPTGTLLATLTGSATAVGASSGGTSTFAAITSDTSADASGLAGWGRCYRSSDGPGASGTNPHLDFAIPADVNFDDENFVAGGVVGITGLTWDTAAWR